MGNVSMEASQINYRGGETKMSVEQALKETSGEAAAIAQLQTDVGNLQTTKANQITIAPFFSAETAYDPGDLVYYNGLTYRCVNAHEGEWDADDFAATTISNELDALKSGLTNVQNNLITLNANSIVRQGIGNQASDITLTFSGKGHTRVANMVLMLANQAYVYPPIPIMFTGVDGPNMDITSVVVAANDLGVTTNGLSITIPSNLCGWGTHLLFKLFPNDNITVTVS